MEQPINQPTHSALQECQTVYMAYLVSPLEHLQPILSFTCFWQARDVFPTLQTQLSFTTNWDSCTLVRHEYHLVFECPNFQPLRDKYHTLFHSETSITPFSTSRTSSMQSFFVRRDRMIVYKFVSDCLDMIDAYSWCFWLGYWQPWHICFLTRVLTTLAHLYNLVVEAIVRTSNGFQGRKLCCTLALPKSSHRIWSSTTKLCHSLHQLCQRRVTDTTIAWMSTRPGRA